MMKAQPNRTMTVLILTAIISFCAHAQPGLLWEKSYGGSMNDWVAATSPAPDGGLVFAGYSNSNDGDVTGNHGGFDWWVARIDSSGSLLWKKTLGGSAGDQLYDICPTSDGGYALAGYTSSNDGDVTGNHGNADYWVVRLDAQGGIVWKKTYGGSGRDYGFAIAQSGSGFIVAGISQSSDGDVAGNYGSDDYWVLQLDLAGNILWEKNLGGTGTEGAFCDIIPLSGGGFALAGKSRSSNYDLTQNQGESDFWIVKMSGTGVIQWQKSLGGSESEQLYSIVEMAGGDLVACGTTGSTNGDVTGNNGNSDIWVVRLSANGQLQWQQCLGGTNYDNGAQLLHLQGGKLLIAGTSRSSDGDISQNHGGSDYWLAQLDNAGNLMWEQNWGGTLNDRANAVTLATDGKLYVAGDAKSSDVDVSFNHGLDDMWVLRLHLPGIATAVASLEVSSACISPNPVAPGMPVKFSGHRSPQAQLTLFDQAGRCVYSGPMQDNIFSKHLSLQAGIYIYQETDPQTQRQVTGRLVISR